MNTCMHVNIRQDIIGGNNYVHTFAKLFRIRSLSVLYLINHE